MGVSRRFLVVVVAVLVLAGGATAAGILLTRGGSGSSGGPSAKPRYAYPANATAQFLAACERHSQKSACECVLHAYQATMPYQVYNQIARGGVRPNNQGYFNAFTAASSGCPQ